MALLWAESIAKYSTATDNDVFADNYNWSGDTVSPGIVAASVGRFGGNAYQCTGSSPFTSPHLRIPLATGGMSGTTLIVGFALMIEPPTGLHLGIDWFLNIATTAAGSTFHFLLGLTPGGGTLVVSDATAAETWSAPCAIYNGVWHWIELKVSLLDSGSFEVRVDGVTVIQDASADCRSGTGDSSTIGFLCLTGADDVVGTGNLYYGDIIVMDGSGSAPFNDFLGDVRIENSVADADGATADWTSGNAGANYTNIDDTLGAYNKDTGTDYIHSTTDEQVNLASHANHTLTNVTTIHAVKLSALAKNDGADNLALRAVSNATPADSADITLLNGTYKWANHFFLVDPDTTAAWTLSAINAATWGVVLKE